MGAMRIGGSSRMSLFKGNMFGKNNTEEEPNLESNLTDEEKKALTASSIFTGGSDETTPVETETEVTGEEPLVETDTEEVNNSDDGLEEVKQSLTEPVSEEPKPTTQVIKTISTPQKDLEEQVKVLEEPVFTKPVASSEPLASSQIEEPPVAVQAVQQQPVVQSTVIETTDETEEGEIAHEQEPSIQDSAAFTRLTQTSEVDSLDANGSYAEMVESMVSSQCQKSGIKNLDLSSFGIRAQALKFPNLTVLNFGKHKFLGVPFTEEEQNKIAFQIGLYVAQSTKERIVLAAVKPVKDAQGMTLYSLLFNDEIAQKFADMFNYKVMINRDVADVSKLVMVVEK